MKFSIALALTLLAAASPAMAGGGHIKHSFGPSGCNNLSAGDQDCNYAARRDPFSVYSYDGRLIGRDPDPNVRMRLRDEDARYRWR